MNNLFTIRFLGAIAVLGLASCSTNYSALKGETDDLYFMAADAKVATEFAVQNNNRENFKQLEQINAEEYVPENFSAKNVNPEYLAKYQSQDTDSDEGTVYFDESTGETIAREGGDINIYNNFRGNSGNNFNSWNMNPWMMSSFYSPLAFSPWGFGGFYDPFWGPSYFRPGFNLSLGFGLGFGSRFGWGFGNPWRYGYGMGYYDPFYSPYYAYGRPIIVVPGGSENRRVIVRGQRPTRGSLATSRSRENLASPNSSRASARREAVSRTSTPSTRANARTDFSRSENDYYNANSRNASAASAAPTRRSVSSPAMSRTSSGSSRDAYTAPSRTLRTSAPSSVDRGSATRSRYAAPSQNNSPSYNRSTSPQYNRVTTPSNNSNSRSTYSSPSRSSSPSYSAPSRSSGSSGGGAVRSSGGSSRRGN